LEVDSENPNIYSFSQNIKVKGSKGDKRRRFNKQRRYLADAVQFFTYTTTTTLTSTTSSGRECVNGFYFPSTGKCYAKFENAKVNWDTASNECNKIGGVLAAIPNKEMQKFLENNFELSDTIGYWIGGERKGGDWTWTDGSPWTGYANWMAGQPDNVENALLIGSDFTWRDWWKFKRQYYMCQY